MTNQASQLALKKAMQKMTRKHVKQLNDTFKKRAYYTMTTFVTLAHYTSLSRKQGTHPVWSAATMLEKKIKRMLVIPLGHLFSCIEIRGVGGLGVIESALSDF
jgi:hypothetical protein